MVFASWCLHDLRVFFVAEAHQLFVSALARFATAVLTENFPMESAIFRPFRAPLLRGPRRRGEGFAAGK
jgi:hypothetical protein